MTATPSDRDQLSSAVRTTLELPTDRPFPRFPNNLSDVEVTSVSGREAVVGGGVGAGVVVPWRTLGEWFESVVVGSPDVVAVVDVDGSTVSFAELNVRANRVAHRLRGLGVGAESVVGVCVESGMDVLVALLGVVKSGGAYVPLDPDLPPDRLGFMLADSGARVVVTQRAVVGVFGSAFGGEVVFVDELASGVESNPAVLAGPDNLVYVMYTSGSTGGPKGVMVSHRALLNYLWWAMEGYGLGGAHGAPMLGSAGFDLSVPNFFLPLVGGKDVTLLPRDRVLSGLAELLVGGGRDGGDFSLLKVTPGHLDVLRGMLGESARVSSVRAYVVGADEVRPETVAAWRRIAPGARLIDEYGPTETVVGCSAYEVGEGFDASVSVPIGRPIANMRMYVLGAGFEPVPVGVVGELFIGGVGLARGYRGRAGLTGERFVPDPFGGAGLRMYRTGDLARFRADGNVEFIGRIDHQVKIRGYRVELGEVEARLMRHPAVSEALVDARQASAGHKRLVAYLVARPGCAIDLDDLREFTAKTLPEYMVPSRWVVLDRMPLTSAGKLDRAAMPDPDRMLTRSVAASIQSGDVAGRGTVESARLIGGLFPYAPALIVPMARHRVPGVGVALLADGEISAWGQGVTGGEPSVPVAVDTLFPACSVSKHVTTLAVLRLVQEGRVDLDQNVQRYLHSWRVPPGQPVTLRALLSHTAGLMAGSHRDYPPGGPLPELREVLDRVVRDRPVGSGFHYSNAHFVVIQQVLADVTGCHVADLLRSSVLDPLGMLHSGYEQNVDQWHTGSVAYGHDRDGAPYPGGWRVTPEVAGSGLWSTPGDLARCQREVLRAATGGGSVFLSRELAELMVTPVAGRYGLGTATSPRRNSHWFGHPGERTSHHAIAATDLRSGAGLVVMANIAGGSPFATDLINQLGVDLHYLIG